MTNVKIVSMRIKHYLATPFLQPFFSHSALNAARVISSLLPEV